MSDIDYAGILLDLEETNKKLLLGDIKLAVASPRWQFLICACSESESKEHMKQVAKLAVYIIDANNPKDGLPKVHDRVLGVQLFLEHHKGFLYILTDAHSYDENELLDGNYKLDALLRMFIQLIGR
ncbi:hypothetical protein Tco_0439757, partial [Tanacetum coccineum]